MTLMIRPCKTLSEEDHYLKKQTNKNTKWNLWMTNVKYWWSTVHFQRCGTRLSTINHPSQTFIHQCNHFDEWYHIAYGTVQDSCNPNGTAQAVKERLELIKSVSSRMTEGQHLLNCTSESLTKVLSTTDESQQEEMKNALSNMRKNCDQLLINIGK